ncbi:ABC transporter permease [Citricoccus sp. GCM10030269]|uniref:ABC transporter permease n=1 Tax=Citricoccus sp. GCM10030269 TaxID=3273388 RepID=UPI00361D8525
MSTDRADARTTVAEGPERVQVQMSGLQRVGARLALHHYLARLWRFRDFIYFEARASVGTRNKNNLLGNIWLVLTPLLNGLTYFLVFGVLLQTSRGVENYLGFLVIGVFMFQFTSRCVSQGANSLVSNRSVVKAFDFPRAVMPISTVLKELLAFIPALVMMIILILVLPEAEQVTWLWLLVIPILLLQVLMGLGISLILARWVSRVRDISQLITFGNRLWLYGSGVFYSVERFVSDPDILAILELNPMHQVLEMTRNSVLYATAPGWENWLILGGWAVGLTLIGTLVFWKADEKYGKEETR